MTRQSKQVQYWRNGIMMTVVTATQADEIIKNFRLAGYKVYDNDSYFSVEEKEN